MFNSFQSFLTNPAWTRFLDSSWRGVHGYFDVDGRQRIDTIATIKLSNYHLYCIFLGLDGPHAERLPVLVRQICEADTDGGAQHFLEEITEHPTHCSFTAEALGCAAFYGAQVGLGDEIRAQAGAALARIVTRNPRIRPPNGIAGMTQQLHFETTAYYWYWQHTGQEKDREMFLTLFEKCIDHYTHPLAHEGGFIAPALHPDWTWSYEATSGTTTTYATNTHKPAYYAGEQSAFLFTYLHGLRTRTLPRNAAWDRFYQGYVGGLFRYYSRAGHTSADVDGYGIHRAWSGSLLTEMTPYEAAAASQVLGFPPEWTAWMGWYAKRHMDFLRRCESFATTGLPPRFPYGHRIGVEKQFNVFDGVRFYAHLARSCFEYRAVRQQWLRVSNAVLRDENRGRDLPAQHSRYKIFWRPSSGYPARRLPRGHPDGRRPAHVRDEQLPRGIVAHRGGRRERQRPPRQRHELHGPPVLRGHRRRRSHPHVGAIHRLHDSRAADGRPGRMSDDLAQVILPEEIRFWSRHRFAAERFSFDRGYRGRAGFYIGSPTFNFPTTAAMQPELADANRLWSRAEPDARKEGAPAAFRLSDGPPSVEVRLSPLFPLPPGACAICEEIPVSPGNPGGENSFCPFPLLRLRIVLPRTHEMAFAVEMLPHAG